MITWFFIAYGTLCACVAVHYCLLCHRLTTQHLLLLNILNDRDANERGQTSVIMTITPGAMEAIDAANDAFEKRLVAAYERDADAWEFENECGCPGCRADRWEVN